MKHVLRRLHDAIGRWVDVEERRLDEEQEHDALRWRLDVEHERYIEMRDIAANMIRGLAQDMRANSERWFPQIHDGSVDLITFYGLGLSGEAGEVSDDVKKRMRDHGDFDRTHLAEELADTMTYLFLLADELDVDLVAEYHRKVEKNEQRWGLPEHGHTMQGQCPNFYAQYIGRGLHAVQCQRPWGHHGPCGPLLSGSTLSSG